MKTQLEILREHNAARLRKFEGLESSGKVKALTLEEINEALKPLGYFLWWGRGYHCYHPLPGFPHIFGNTVKETKLGHSVKFWVDCLEHKLARKRWHEQNQ